MIPVRTWGYRYLFFQSVAVAIWWLAMLSHPEWRALFFVLPTSEMYWMPFLLPDTIFLVGAGWLAAVGLRHEDRWAWPMLLIHTGAVGYAALYGLVASATSGAGWLGTGLMLGSFLVTGWLARKLRPY